MRGAIALAILDDLDLEEKYAPHLSFRCPSSVRKRLNAAAKTKGVSRSKIILRLLVHALDEYESEKKSQPKR